MAALERPERAVAVSPEPVPQRAIEGPRPSLSVASVLALQRTAGNAAIARALAQRAPAAAPVLQRYTEIATAAQTADEWSAGGKPVRVADDGSMAVRQDSQYGSHRLWAAASRIALANAALIDKGSVVRLKAGADTIKGTPSTGGPSRTLNSVEPQNTATSTSGTTMSIWADCGMSARDVMGVGGGGGKNYADVTAKYTDGSEKQTSASNPKAMADEILKKTLGKNFIGSSTADGWKRYWKLKPAAREQFDKDHGLNRYAEPDVGDGFTMASGGNDYPGKATWNFHWAGVIMSNGTDHVTLENYAVGDASVKNTDWDFQMYGPPSKSGQTFHDQHKATQQHGDAPTTMAVGQR